MNKRINYIYLSLVVLILNTSILKAQQKFATEADLKKEASTLFENDEFDKAFPLYSQLTSIYPKDPDYNYRLGVCMIYSFEDKEKPIRFLEYASTKPEVDKEVLYYLAKAYHLNYRFDDAIVKYKEYKKVASSAKAQKLQVDRQIEMCKNGKLLLRNLSDLIVMDKKEMSREDFFRAYDVTGLGGKLLVKPEDKPFKTSLDKKKKETSVIFSAAANSQIFFSSYGDDASKGKDIYTIKRKDNGEWTSPQNLGAPVNTEYDEDFPFLHPNGKILYFCSKGHNSMGGFDIFKSAWNETTFTWGTPVNVDFPINTPDDDVLYVTDFYEKQAYFASSRSSTSGKIEVYHINVDRKPIDLTFINGTVIKSQGDNTMDLKIIVKDLNNNSILGIYNTSPADGTYSMKLPNGGKYLFTIESPTLPTQSEVVVLPVQHEFKPIAQEISLTAKKDKLVLKTIFEGTGDDSNYLLASNFIREKARMEVNVSDYSSNYSSSPNPPVNNNPNVASNNSNSNNANATNGKPPKTKLSNVELVKIAKDDAKDIDIAAKDAKEQADIALNYANQKNQMADSKTKEASQLLADANKATDVTKKQAIMAQANEKNALAQQLNDETAAAFNLAKKLDLVSAAKQKEADLSKQYANDLEAAVKSTNAEDAISKLEEQQKKLEALSKENSTTGSIVQSLKLDEENKEKELAKAQRGVTETKQEIADNETILSSLKADAAKAKKEDLKQGLAKQIAELTEDNNGLEKELAKKTAKADQLEKEYEGIKNQSSLVKSVVADSKTGTSEAAAASVANIDKTKLEQKVNEIAKVTTENSNVISGISNPANPANNANNTTAATNTNQPPAANSNTANTNSPVSSTTQPVVATNTPATNTSTNPVTNAPATNTNAANNAPTTTSPQPTVVAVESINKKYQDQVAATTKITNEAEREQAKSEVLKTWNKEIDENVAKQKEILKTSASQAEKDQFTKSIAEAEKLSGDLKTQTAESVAKVETLKKNTTVVAANNPANNLTSNNSANPPANQTPAGTNTNVTAANTNPPANNGTPVASSTGKTDNTTFESLNKKYEDEVAATSKLTNEVEREQAKTEVLKTWNKAIDEKITKQKEELKTTTDPEEKNLYAKKIADAELASKDLQKQTNESVAKVETLKKQQGGVAVTNQGNNANTTNTTSEPVTNTTSQPGKTNTENAGTSPANNTNAGQVTNNTTVPNPTGNAPAIVSLESINVLYQGKIATTEKIANETEHEQAKSEILKAWNTAILENVSKQKEILKTITLPEEKKLFTQKIAEGELASKDLEKQITDTVARIETLKKQEAEKLAANTPSTTPAANNTATQPTNAPAPVTANRIKMALPSESINSKYQDQLAATAKMTNELEREQSKSDILKNWDNAVEENLTKQYSDLNTTTDQDEKLVISKSISEAEQFSKDLKKQTSESLAKVETLKKQQAETVAANGTNANANTTNTGSQQPVAANTEATNNNTTNNTTGTQPPVSTTNVPASNSNTNTTVPNANAAVPNTNNTNIPSAVNLASLNQKYVEEIKSADKITNPIEREQTKTEVLKTWNNEINKNIAQQKEELAKTADPEERNLYAKIIADAEKLSAEISNQTKQKVAKVETLKKEQNSVAVNANNLGNTAPGANNPVNEPSSTISANNNTISEPIVLAPNEIYEHKNVAAYSETKPIPLDEKIPEGLVFKVQIGAFAKPIPQDLFEGIQPITGETTKEGYTRYTAGMFVKFNSAQKAKEQINGFGYKDAFVVAFLNGKRISITEAFALINNNPANFEVNQPLPVATNNQPVANTSTVNPPAGNSNQQSGNEVPATSNTNQTVTNNSPSGVNNTVATNTTNAANTNTVNPNNATVTSGNNPVNSTPANPVAVTPGVSSTTGNEPATNTSTTTYVPVTPGQVIYTVQVGVFSQPLSEDKAKNIPQLVSEKTPNGYIRYNSGSFESPKLADKVKNAIVAAGYKDAFVTAYYNGKRISVTQAEQLQNQGAPVITSPVASETATGNIPANATGNIPASTQQNSPTIAEMVKNNAANSSNNGKQPATNNQAPATEDKLPSSIEQLTSNIQQMATNQEPTAVTPSEPVLNSQPGEPVIRPAVTNAVKPSSAEQTPTANYTEAPPSGEQLSPLPDSTKQNLIKAIAKFNEIPMDSGVVFKVQIGVFKEMIPLPIANSFLKIAKQGIKNYKDENGYTVYILGNFKTMEDAAKTKNEVAASDQLKDAFIVAFSDGKKISLEEANKLLNK